MKALGKHLLVEYYGCDRVLLNDFAQIELLLNRAASLTGATIVASIFHPYAPQGVTGVVVVEESHLSIHTWPEYGYAAVDVYTCGNCFPELANDFLREQLGATSGEVLSILRGSTENVPMKVYNRAAFAR